ncbi:MAG: CPBP family intramembrane glutamic endopeptidase [Bacteroidota bacterium]
MFQVFRNWYVLVYLLIYFTSVAVLHLIFDQSLAHLLPVFLCVGMAFSSIAWVLVRNCSPLIPDKPPFKNEWIVIVLLVLWFLFYVTYGTSWINNLVPVSIKQTAWKNEIAVVIKKLLVFVFIPFAIYKTFNFSLADFGLTINQKEIFGRKSIIIFLVLSVAILLFQYFLSGGAKPFRDGIFNFKQLITGLPLLFIWLFIEAGLVEEFFFRAILQSRIAVLLKSQVAGIIISGLIFGIAHAPGLYLRGAESEGINEVLPFGFWLAYTISAMSVAGIFLGIIWSRTKNLCLVMAIHAMVDLLPGAKDFFHTWNV